MRARAIPLALAAWLATGCWFPGNPLGYSGNHEPDPDCPVADPAGKPCNRDKAQYCVRKSWRYECFDAEWHRSG